MKERFNILLDFIRFIFIGFPVFLIVYTIMHIGFFFYDIYNLTKKIWKNFSKQ